MELVSIAEIAALLNVSKQNVANWRSRSANFPEPIASLACGPIWTKAVIVKWAKRNKKDI